MPEAMTFDDVVAHFDPAVQRLKPQVRDFATAMAVKYGIEEATKAILNGQVDISEDTTYGRLYDLVIDYAARIVGDRPALIATLQSAMSPPASPVFEKPTTAAEHSKQSD